MNNKTFRDHISQQCGFTPNKAKPYALQVCNAGAMPEDFTAWLKANGDSIDIGGNWISHKVAANHDQYDNERHPFA